VGRKRKAGTRERPSPRAREAAGEKRHRGQQREKRLAGKPGR
jgi:hypothetical protein